MALINKSLLDQEITEYLEPLNANNLSGILLEEVVHDYCEYIDPDYPTFGEHMNQKYLFKDVALLDMGFRDACKRILDEHVKDK